MNDLDQQLIKEAKNPEKEWKVDPYQGKIQKEELKINSEEQIQMKLAEALSHVDREDPDLNRLPVLGILGSLKKEMDKKYRVDTLKQLQAIDSLTIKTD